MKKLTLAGLIGLALLLVSGGLVVWRGSRPAEPAAVAPARKTVAPAVRPPANSSPPRATTAPMTPEEKSARVERIKRDYDEVRTKTSADYAAAGTAFPGGLSAFLRQLALLERELHNDYAAVLLPRELEDLELRDTAAGQLVQKLLGDTAATDEQRRAVFRLQREFDNRFALTFDISSPILLTRETERQATQEKICAVLGDALFASWLRGEGADYANFTAFVGSQGLLPDAALRLWRAKNDYTLRRLMLNAQQGLSPEGSRSAQAALAQNARMQVLSILGPVAFQAAGPDVLGWLPPGR